MSKKTTVIVFLAVLIPALFFVAAIQSGYIAQRIEYIHSYVVYTDDTTIFMLNGTNGVVDYSSLDASTVFNFAFGNLSDGGSVFVKSGVYWLNSTIYIPSNVLFEGEGNSSFLILMADRPAQTRMIHNANFDTGDENIIIQNIALDGNKDNQVSGDLSFEGINFERATNCLISDVLVQNTYAEGIDLDTCNQIISSNIFMIETGGYGFHFSTDTHNSTLSDSIAYRCGLDRGRGGLNSYLATSFNSIQNSKAIECNVGIEITGGSYNTINDCVSRNSTEANYIIKDGSYHILSNSLSIDGLKTGVLVRGVSPSHVTVIGNKIVNSGYHGIRLAGDYHVVTNNDISHTVRYQGIAVDVAYKSIISDNIIKNAEIMGIEVWNTEDTIFEGNSLSDDHSRTQYGIRETGSSDNNLILGNKLITSFKTAQIVVVGANTVVRYNTGFVTENHGDSNGGSPLTVAHGLAGSPTGITVVPTDDVGDFWVDTVGAANFNINWDGGGSQTFYWDVIYDPV